MENILSNFANNAKLDNDSRDLQTTNNIKELGAKRTMVILVKLLKGCA